MKDGMRTAEGAVACGVWYNRHHEMGGGRETGVAKEIVLSERLV